MQPDQSQNKSEKPVLPQLLDHIDGVYWEAVTDKFSFSAVRGRVESLLGYPLEAWYEDNFWLNHLHPDDSNWVPQFCMQAVAALKNHQFNYRMIAADGRTVWVHDRVTVVVNDGKVEKVCGLLLDITENRDPDLEPPENTPPDDRSRNRGPLRTTGVGYWDRDYVRNQCTLSEEAARILGCETANSFLDLEAGDQAFHERIHPDDRQRVLDASAEALAGTKPYDIEYRLIVQGGEERYVHSRGEVLRDASGKPTRWFGTIEEISKLRRVERELYESQIRFRLCLDHASDMLMLLDNECNIVDVNRTTCDSLGYTREELIGKSSGFFDCTISAEAKAAVQERLSRGETVEFESRHQRKNGKQIPVHVRIAPVKSCGNVNAISLATDITERQNSQLILTNNYNLMRAIVNGTSDIIYAKDLDGHYLLINTAGASLFELQVEDVVCRKDSQLPSTEAAQILLQSTENELSPTNPYMVEQNVVVDGKTCTFLSMRFSYYNSDGKAIGTIGISRDVTEVKQLGDALRHSQKMEAVGRLAGGIAHDFNNLLTVIISYSELLLMSLPEGDPQRHQVNEIFKCGERAAGLTRQLLAFSRKQELQPQIVNLRQAISDLAKLIKPIVGADIELNIEVADNVPDVKMDLDQFRQSILNLAANARDAMPHGGKMTILVDDFVVLPSNQAEMHPHLKAGRYARISFSDTGIGMSESMQSRIFEPFFTTKPIGKGSGLGLSMTYGFVTQSGGHIEVSSVSGCGSTFRLYLPCAPVEQETSGGAPISHEIQATILNPAKGKETVLLVEDEETDRVLCYRILEACGYEVLQAKDGIEALELLKSSECQIDLLLTDVVMPRMNGPKLLEALEQDRPNLPVIFISGYADEVVLLNTPQEKRNLLRKPFSPKQLADRVRGTLEASAKLGSNC